MSEPDELKDGAEKEAAEHPERISEVSRLSRRNWA